MLFKKRQWKKWTLPSKYSAASFFIGVFATLLTSIQFIDWLYEYKNDPMKAQEHLKISQNYKEANKIDEALTYALKAYEINKFSKEALYETSLLYFIKGFNESDNEIIKKSENLLISNKHYLSDKETALLGLISFQLENYQNAFEYFKDIDLDEVSALITPLVMPAYANSALYATDYQSALLYVQKALHQIDYINANPNKMYSLRKDRKIKDFKIKLSLKDKASKLRIGKELLKYAIINSDEGNYKNAILIANDGFIFGFGTYNEKSLLNSYLEFFNYITADKHDFVKNNPELITASIKKYISTLKGMVNPSYKDELVKVKYLSNYLIDSYDLKGDKYTVSDGYKFNVLYQVSFTDFSGISSIEVLDNILLPNGKNLSPLVKGTKMFKENLCFVSPDKFYFNNTYIFPVETEDMAGNKGVTNIIPAIFHNQDKCQLAIAS